MLPTISPSLTLTSSASRVMPALLTMHVEAAEIGDDRIETRDHLRFIRNIGRIRAGAHSLRLAERAGLGQFARR